MATIGKVSAVFTASTSGLVSGTQAAGSAFKSLQGDLAGLRGGISALVTINAAQFFGQLASGAARAVGSMISMGQAQAEVIDPSFLVEWWAAADSHDLETDTGRRAALEQANPIALSATFTIADAIDWIIA